MKILVTGANGYLGRGIVTNLIDMGAEVIATDIAIDRIDERCKSVCCNVFDIEAPYDYFGQPDVLLHLAWRNGFVHNSPTHVEDIPMHYSFIKKMLAGGIKRICVMGSMHEIGFFEGSINENTPCNPMSLYGVAKDSLRRLTFLLANQYNAVFQWLRGYYIVSPSTVGNSIFSKIALAAENGKKEFPFTTGQNQYDFLDYEDFCYQTACAVSQEKINGVINICSGKPEKLCDRVERFIKENNFDIKLLYGTFPDRKYDSLAVWGNGRKIEEILSERSK